MQTTTAQPYASEGLNTIYELLFCDKPFLFTASEEARKHYPWNILLAEQPPAAELEAIAADASAETRMQLLAYNRLQEAGFKPQQKKLLGVVIEVGLEDGLDTLAAYKDGTARYINHSGKMIIWDSPEQQSQSLINELFLQSEEVVKHIGPWDKERLAAPATGDIRLSFLLSDGLYFGQGPFRVLQQDRMGGPVVDAATQLMMFLVDRASAQ